MGESQQAIDWASVASRVVLLAVVWWALTDGAAGSWWIGAPAVAGAVILSLKLLPPARLDWRHVIGFVPFFLWHSLKGGMDVARRALAPDMPIAPQLIEYRPRLPPGLAQVALINITSVLPGTLCARIDGPVLKIHVLDSRGDYLSGLIAVEQRVSRMCGIPIDDSPRR